MHLAKEDEYMYPKLIEHSDQKVSKMAKDFQKEMGGIKGVFGEFHSSWIAPKKLEGNPVGFLTELTKLVGAVKKRIEREENELYKAFDAA